MSDARKTFYLNADKEKPITAAGVMIYRFYNNDIEVLLVDSRGTYEDLGGRADTKDKDILSTAAREAFEESNELLNKRKIKSRLKTAPFVYVEKMKYIVYIIPANSDEKFLVSSDFGDTEKHDNISRTIKWFSLSMLTKSEIFKDKLNWRIKNRKIFDILKEIKDENKINIGIFSTASDESAKSVKVVKKQNDDDEKLVKVKKVTQKKS